MSFMKNSLVVLLVLYFTACALQTNDKSSEKEKFAFSFSEKYIGLEKNRTFQWLGIPYAQAPVGSLRWKAPRSLENENDQVKAIEFSNPCPQVESISIDKKGEGEFLGSEDCLFLNIFAPKNISSDKKLPVMFWIHGGGNTSGEAGSYDFSKLAAAHDLVIVSINYRLGFLGWFTIHLCSNFK